MNKLSSWFSLFASTSTLICCALPSLLVALGMGSVMVGLITTVPQIIWLSKYKFWVFLFSAIMIGVSAYIQYKTRSLPCPVDRALAKTCRTSRIWSEKILLLSGLLWLTGAFFAFLAPRFF